MKQNNNTALWLSLASGALLLGSGLIILILIINSLTHIFPNQTTLAGVNISLLTPDEARQKIQATLQPDNDFLLTFTSGQKTYSTPSGSINFTYQIDESVATAFTQTHQSLSLTKPLDLIKTIFGQHQLPLLRTFDSEKLRAEVARVAQQIDQPGHEPFAKLGKVGDPKTLTIDPGKVGLALNQDQLLTQATAALTAKNDGQDLIITLNPTLTHSELDESEQKSAYDWATKFVNLTVKFTHPDYKDISWEIKPQEMVGLLSFPQGLNVENLNLLLEKMDNQVRRPSQNATFTYEKLTDGRYQVSEFIPHQDGLQVDKNAAAAKIKQLILDQAQTATSAPETANLELTLEIVKPEKTLAQTNDLGINELIGFGDSYYAHSIPNRVWNVALTAKKINFTLIPPRAEFRFNDTLGEVSKSTGYRSAYVISDGKTVLGDGGGVCQVSTTVFRAALNAGLDITKRKAHSYRVSYYELNQKPGIDATVYSGDTDLRFINDTPGYILIKTTSDSDNLYMKVELYGTDDGRVSEILNHKTWDLRAAPPTAYYPTTDIPQGQLKQIDWAVSGIKASFEYVVKDRNGNITTQEEYFSNYVPWSAKYLQGI